MTANRSVFFVFIVSLWTFLSLLCYTCRIWGENDFPFEGKITADHVNVRSGANINFETLTQLNKGDRVTVLSHLYGWYEIKIPDDSLCFIAAEYVDKGIVTGDNVNLRARPDMNSNILAQLNNGNKVSVIKEEKNTTTWYRIAPPEYLCAWVSDEYVIRSE